MKKEDILQFIVVSIFTGYELHTFRSGDHVIIERLEKGRVEYAICVDYTEYLKLDSIAEKPISLP